MYRHLEHSNINPDLPLDYQRKIADQENGHHQHRRFCSSHILVNCEQNCVNHKLF